MDQLPSGESSFDATKEDKRFSFAGNAKEYFGIWIVNVLLTIITFGIYSAWAKVRRNRYFYGNTDLNGRRFDYHAEPIQILIGRMIVFVFLIVYNLLLELMPVFGLVLSIGLIFLFPWLAMRSLRFNARVTSYNNVRFDFSGGYGGAFKAFTVGGFVSGFSLGLLAPYASKWTYGYLFDNLRYGQLSVSNDVRAGALYRIWYLPAFLTVLGLGLLVGLGMMASGLARELMDNDALGQLDDGTPIGILALVYIAFFALFITYGIAGLVYSAGARNVAFGATVIDGRHRLFSDLPRGRYVWIYITNVLVTVLTFGLMRPWAAVRMARFTSAHTAIRFSGDPGEVISKAKDEGSAVGSEYMDVEGIDFGI